MVRKLINMLRPIIFTQVTGSQDKTKIATSDGVECASDSDAEALEINLQPLQDDTQSEDLVLGSNNIQKNNSLSEDFRFDRPVRLTKKLEDNSDYEFDEAINDFFEPNIQASAQHSDNKKKYNTFELESVLRGRNDLPNDFGYSPYNYPYSVRDLKPTPIIFNLRPHGAKLSGDSYDDLISVLSRIKTFSDPDSIDSKIVKDSVQTFLEYLCGQRGVNYTAGTVCIEQLSISKIERDLLRDENKKLHGEISHANAMNNSLTTALNSYRVGSLAGRTTHQLCLYASNECYVMITNLIKSSALYDKAIEIPGIGKNTLATLRSTFGRLSDLALATTEVILSLDGVGPVTLEKIICFFNDINLPAVCVISWKLGEKLHWRAVSTISSIDDYKWKLPSFMFPFEAALTRREGGASSLEVINLEENHYGGPLKNE